MPNLGFAELLLILMLIALIFGGSRLPALGDALGRTLRNFKRSLSSDDRIDVRSAESGRDAGADSRADHSEGETPHQPSREIASERKGEPDPHASSAGRASASGDKNDATDAEIVEKR